MVWIDTNIIYLLSGIDSNPRIKKEKLIGFFRSEDVVIYDISLFEILNNCHHRDQCCQVINSLFENTKSFSYVTSSFLASYYNPLSLIHLENESPESLERIQKEMAGPIVDVFTVFYSELLSCALVSYFIPFVNLCDEDRSDQKEKFQHFYGILGDRISDYLRIRFDRMILNDGFCEKNRKALIENLFFNLVSYYAADYNGGFNDLDLGSFDIETLLNRLIDKAKSLDVTIFDKKTSCSSFYEVSLFRSMSELISKSERANLQGYLVKIASTLAKDFWGSEFINNLFFETLIDFLTKKARFNDNDLLDALLLEAPLSLFAHGDIDGVVTFDRHFKAKIKKYSPKLLVMDEKYFQ